MNVCIATSAFPINRNELYHGYMDELINTLIKNGHTVSVLTQEKKGEKEKFHPDVEVVWFPWKMTGKIGLAEMSFKKFSDLLSTLSIVFNGVRYSRKVSTEKNIDIFICLWIVPSGLYVYLKNIFFKKTPYIVWALGSDVYNNKDNFVTRFLLRLIIRNSKAAFADGFELCDIVKRISSRECEFLPTFHKIDIPVISVDSVQPTKKETTFLYIGRLSHVKGVDILVESFKLLQRERVKFKCNIIGDGEMMQELKEEVNKSGLDGKVIFLGKITDEKQKAAYFNSADCIVIPSRSESIPIVLSEAVQFGKPMITTNAGDMELLVKKYSLGLVAKKEDPATLAEAIKQFIAKPIAIDPSERTKLLDVLLFENSTQKLLNKI